MSTRAPGMDHTLYPFSAMPDRPALHWPGGARLAVTVFLYLEHWELLPPDDAVRDPRFRDAHGAFTPDYRSYTWREYGNRVGIFRLLDALDASGLKVTVAANAGACTAYPELVERRVARGYEFAGHGDHATRMLSGRMTEAEEQAAIAAALDTVAQATGRRPTGWISQDYGESTRTPGLLAAAGLDYVVDWPNDDQPYPMTVGRPFVSIPSQAEWDDVQLQWHRRVLAPRFPGIIGDALDRLSGEAGGSGRFFGLHLHPWLAGMPHRFPHMAAAIARVAATPDCWPATAGDVARHMLATPPG